MKDLFHVILGTVISLAVVYGIYYFFKTISYWLFYEGMVKNTIIEIVKQSALR